MVRNTFTGVAHPVPTKGDRAHPADLTGAEIRTTNLTGKPLLVEHKPGSNVGNVLASWPGTRGELKVLAHVDDEATMQKVRDGSLRGLSLGTGMLQSDDGQVLYRAQDELSVCVEGRRPGTWIDTVEGKTVHTSYNASKGTHTVGMSDEPIMADGGVTKESYDSLKKELEEARSMAAQAAARSEVFDARERTRVSAWQADVKGFFNMIHEEGDDEVKADLAPLSSWVDEYVSKKDIHTQAPLARLMSCASKSIKRARDDASVAAQTNMSLADAMKQCEELKQERDGLRQRVTETEALATERQTALAELEQKLAASGVLGGKWDFSKLSSREKKVDADTAAAAPTGGVTASTDQASRGSGNPLEDPLLSFINSNGSGGLRMRGSGTAHQLLGSADGSASDIASAIARGY